MDNRLLPEEDKHLRDILDKECGICIPIEDSLRYVFMHYPWKDQIPEDARPDSGIPMLPNDVSLLELDIVMPEMRATILENLIRIYLYRSRNEYVYGEGLRRLLFVQFEHVVEVPERLKLWAYSTAVVLNPKHPEGWGIVRNSDFRIYTAYKFLKYYKSFINKEACVFIGNCIGKSSETIEKSIIRTKNRNREDFLQINPPN